MIDEDKKKAQNLKLAAKADDVAREALHFMANERPDEYGTVCVLAEQNPGWLRRLLRALYIAGYHDGQKALDAAMKATEEAKNKTLN